MKKLKLPFVVFLMSLILLNVTLIYGINYTKNNLENYFRLHVVANSDSISDQMLKLKVSMAVDEYIKNLTCKITNTEEYVALLKKHIPQILKEAQNTLNENDSNYNITAYLGNIKYDKKEYNDLKMPAGTYNSLKIVIGDGKGENWWSLLSPSLPGNITINEALTNPEIKFESKILEMFNTIISRLK